MLPHYCLPNANPIKKGGGWQKRLWASNFNCSQTDQKTFLPMVCKFNFSRYGHIEKSLVLYVPQFNLDGPLKSEGLHFKI